LLRPAEATKATSKLAHYLLNPELKSLIKNLINSEMKNITKKIILAGGSGFLGRALAKELTGNGYEVVILSRRIGESNGKIRTAFWDGQTMGAWCAELDGAHAVINLSGRSVDCRYTLKNRRAILESRLKSTRILALAIKDAAAPPKLWVNAASATIYADTRGEAPANTEVDGVIGEGFSVGVCQAWEAEFNRWTLPATRQVCLRVAITLGAEGGAMVPLIRLAKLGLGGQQGDGQQYVSWLHIDDLCGIVAAVVEGRLQGDLYNCASPQAVKNVDFMRAIRRAVGGLARYIGLPTPKVMLKIGAWLIRTETELVLKSRKVAPQNLMNKGYRFQYEQIEDALSAILLKPKIVNRREFHDKALVNRARGDVT
jgi:uncharacterized protein (TIGR01777 family)